MTRHYRSTSEVVSDYDISLAEVHAVLSYYDEHKERLDEDIRR